ncbi:wiskott-Aldrich syndrome binding protein Lsb1 [Schizosaccharomyces japonicus yFS275]|uniref:Wiskott-Aldrich syndrome binding protein Lsb1 n=1 Tax=Schizosaccharomyces japonicus (strain yFS275 / FY16936) TaxID=402676 RepID=B6K750_SCHJY|nr:wiskott-Aldrich syndrome binding protein Lsb1 [Schizosaccharomyces japonicus yFS275]EEB09354.1 wiskott-Aldrich syndrome binding protein Lsb1 [Schizosaccharomyces japonicus yFS275]
MQAPAAPVQAAAPAPVPAPAAPAQQYELARALYDFKGKDRGDLSFRRNETITVLEHINNDWWRGSIDKRHGIFPSNYVEIIRSPVYGSGHTGSPMPPMPVQQPQPTGPVMQPMPMAPMPYAQPMAVQPMPAQPVIVQQEAPQKHSKLGDLGSNIGNAFVFGAAATAGADIINSIF